LPVDLVQPQEVRGVRAHADVGLAGRRAEKLSDEPLEAEEVLAAGKARGGCLGNRNGLGNMADHLQTDGLGLVEDREEGVSAQAAVDLDHVHAGGRQLADRRTRSLRGGRGDGDRGIRGGSASRTAPVTTISVR